MKKAPVLFGLWLFSLFASLGPNQRLASSSGGSRWFGEAQCSKESTVGIFFASKRKRLQPTQLPEPIELLRRRDAEALVQPIYDIYMEQKHKEYVASEESKNALQ